jgi:hypothetical protein
MQEQDRKVQSGRRPRRKRPHAAARSRVVAGVMSCVALVGLGAGFAGTAAATSATRDASSSTGSAGSTSSTSNDDSGAMFVPAVPGTISSGQTPVTSSGGS